MVRTLVKRVGRGGAAVALAAAVNLALFWMMAQLNQLNRSPAERERRPEVRYVVRSNPAPQREQREHQQKDQPEQEVMKVDVQQPEPTPVQAEPVPVAMAMPEAAVSPVAVRVSSEPAAPSRTSEKSSQSSGGSSGGDLSSLSQSFEAEAVDQPPREISTPSPSYPRRALRRGIEGSVVVRLLIDRSGRVEDARVVQVDGPNRFGEAVMEVVQRWRFEPARHRGQRVRVWGVKTVRFELRG